MLKLKENNFLYGKYLRRVMIVSVLKLKTEVAGEDSYPMFWWRRIPTDESSGHPSVFRFPYCSQLINIDCIYSAITLYAKVLNRNFINVASLFSHRKLCSVSPIMA